MGEMRQRMEEELRLRRYSDRTVQAYLGQMVRFVKHYGRAPEELTGEEIRAHRPVLACGSRPRLSCFTGYRLGFDAHSRAPCQARPRALRDAVSSPTRSAAELLSSLPASEHRLFRKDEE